MVPVPSSVSRSAPALALSLLLKGCSLLLSACSLLLGGCSLLLGGCITPPAVLPAGIITQDLADFPPGSERVEVRGEDGVFLRGVFVPGVSGAPVVLHLMPAGCSITYGTRPHDFRFNQLGDPSVWDMHQLGLASLVLDYQGVGSSTGERSPNHLRADARAAYAEAVRRAGGREDRVVVRGTSIGTLATATLIEADIRPAAVVLFAPIRGETVARNFLYHQVWFPVAWLLAPLLLPTGDVSLGDQLRRVACPLVVFSPGYDQDEFLIPAEAKELEQATRAAGGRWLHLANSHVVCAAAAKYLQPEERTLLHRLFGEQIAGPERAAALRPWLAAHAPELSADERVQAKLEVLTTCLPPEPPELFAAALRSQVPIRALVPWLGWIARNHPGPLPAVPPDAWQALLDLDDRARTLPAAWIRDVAPWLGGRRFSGDPDGIEEFVWQLLTQESLHDYLVGVSQDFHDVGNLFLSLALLDAYGAITADEADPQSCHRLLLRIALKAAGIPDRVVTDRADAQELQVWHQGSWRPLRNQRAPASKLPPEVVLAAMLGGHRSLLWEANPPPWDASIPPALRLRYLLAGLSGADGSTQDQNLRARLQRFVRQAPLDLVEGPGLAAAMAESEHSDTQLLWWLVDLPEIHRQRLYTLPRNVAATLLELDEFLTVPQLSSYLALRNELSSHDVRLRPGLVLEFLRTQVFSGTAADMGNMVGFQQMERRMMAGSPAPTATAVRCRITKITLQAIGVPARLIGTGEQLEIWRDGAWRLLPLDP